MKQQSSRPLVSDKTSGTIRKRRGDIFWVGALALVLLILLHESLFMGKGLVPADAILSASPWRQASVSSNALLADQYRVFIPGQELVHQQKGFPLWNPSICCGAPNLGAIQGAMFFPIRLLLSPLGPFAASGPAAFIKLFLAGWFTFVYVRLLGVSGAGAFLAGIVFSLSGFMIVWLGHPHVNAAMWLPLLLYLVEKAFRCGARQALRAWAGFAVALACMILGGHPPTAIHVMMVVGIYFLIRLVEHRRDQLWARMGLFVASIGIGLLLAAPQILPFLEYSGESSSGAASAALDRWSTHLSVSSFVHFLLPNALGNPSAGHEELDNLLGWHSTDNFNERTGYVGIVPLFLAAYAVALRRCRFTKIFLAFAAGSVLVIFGVPPFPAVFRMLPLFRDVNQTRLLLIVGFSLAVLAALGWDAFAQRKTHQQGMIVAAGFLACVALALICLWRIVGPQVHDLDVDNWIFLRRQFLILASGLGVVLVLVLLPMRSRPWIAAAVCTGWMSVDLLCFASGYNPAIPRSLYYPKTPAIEWLQKDESQFRIFGAASMLPPNAAEVFGLSDVRGGDFMTVRRYEKLITGAAGDFSFYEYPKSVPPSLPLLNVKYILSDVKLPPEASRELVYSKEILIYRVKAAADRALLVYDSQVIPDKSSVLARVSEAGFDPRKILLLEDAPALAATPPERLAGTPAVAESVHIVSYEPDDVQIDATLPQPGFLLLLDTCFPGWTATVNGERVPISRADYNFRAVSLPAGSSTVKFAYRPRSLTIGCYLCAIGGLAVLGMWLRPWKWKSRLSDD